MHTGGWGMLSRSNGILADYVKAFDVIVGSGETKHVVKPSVEEKTSQENDDLYYAVLGGSNGGSFGVVTQWEFTPLRDADHPNSACYEMYWFKTEDNTRAVMELMQEYSDKCTKGEIPSDYNFGVTINGTGGMHLLNKPTAEAMIKLEHTTDSNLMVPALIQVWMLYSNNGGASKEFDDQWFEGFAKKATPLWVTRKKKTPISYGMSHMYIFSGEREFENPYVKRDQVTMGLPESFADTFITQIEKVTGDFGTSRGIHLMVQLVIFGGGAVLANEADSHSSYSWRGQVAWLCYDAFYDVSKHESAYQHACDWQEENDKVFIGEDGAFAKKDMRMFAFTFGKRVLEEVWQFYYDSKDKYDRLRRIKHLVDPDCVFNSDEFAVKPME